MTKKNKKWTSASDNRLLDNVSYSIAKEMYAKGYFLKLSKYYQLSIDKDLADSETLMVSANKIKALLLKDYAHPEDTVENNFNLKALLNLKLRDEISKKNLYKFYTDIKLIERIKAPIILRLYVAILILKQIYFFISFVFSILFSKSNRQIVSKKNVIIDDDSLFSGVGTLYARTLNLSDPGKTIIFSPEKILQKKQEFFERKFDAYDAHFFCSKITPREYKKFLIGDISLLLRTIICSLKCPEYAFDLYRFMVRMMSWRLFSEATTFSNIFKFMVRPSIVDVYFARQKGAKVSFVYLSTTPNPISCDLNEEIYGNLDYCDMHADYIFCDSISNKIFSSLNGDYYHIPVRPFHPVSPRPYHVSSRKKIVFMDNTWGFQGVNSVNAMMEFFKFIQKISEFNEFDIRIKLKKNNLNYYKSLLRGRNAHYLDDFLQISAKIDALVVTGLSASECIDWSDLVVSSPLSSVIYETISSGSKVLVYDPLSECILNKSFVKSLGKIYFNDGSNLIDILRSEHFFVTYENYISQSELSFLEFEEFNFSDDDFYNVKLSLTKI